MQISVPRDSKLAFDTKEAILLIEGPDSELMQLASTNGNAEELIGHFQSVDRTFSLIYRKVERHPQIEGGWWIEAELPSGRDVFALWDPETANPGYLWLNVNPRQLTFQTTRPLLRPQPGV